MSTKPETLDAVRERERESNTLETKKEKIKKQRENYSNVQFDINSSYNTLFLCFYKLQYLKYLSKEKILKIREEALI